MSSFVGLKRSLPKSGMKYAGFNLLARGSRDRKVAKAIMDAAAAATAAAATAAAAASNTTTNTNTITTTTNDLPKRAVEPLLIQLFDDASGIITARKARGGNSSFTVEFLDLMEALQPARAWTRGLQEPIFIELFAKLSAARAAWWETPTLPYEEERHSELARSIDRFNFAAGGDKRLEWADGGLAMYELAGGLLDADDDDDSSSSSSSNEDEADNEAEAEVCLYIKLIYTIVFRSA